MKECFWSKPQIGGNFPKRGRNVARKRSRILYTKNLHQDRPFPVLVEIFLNEGMADHRKSVLIGFVAS